MAAPAFFCKIQHFSKLNGSVAHNAGIRCSAVFIFLNKIVRNVFLKLSPHVCRDVGNV